MLLHNMYYIYNIFVILLCEERKLSARLSSQGEEFILTSSSSSSSSNHTMYSYTRTMYNIYNIFKENHYTNYRWERGENRMGNWNGSTCSTCKNAKGKPKPKKKSPSTSIHRKITLLCIPFQFVFLSQKLRYRQTLVLDALQLQEIKE